MRDVIDDNTTGLLFPHGDYKALEKALLRLVEDSALRNQVGAGAKQAVYERHTWDANARFVVQLALGESSARTFVRVNQLDCETDSIGKGI